MEKLLMEMQGKGKQEVEARILHILRVSAVCIQQSEEVRLGVDKKKKKWNKPSWGNT